MNNKKRRKTRVKRTKWAEGLTVNRLKLFHDKKLSYMIISLYIILDNPI